MGVEKKRTRKRFKGNHQVKPNRAQGFWARGDDNAQDVTMWKEAHNDYKCLELDGKKVLDLGGNIGGFIDYAKAHNAAVVHSYEPDVNNFNILCKNVKDVINSKGVKAFNCAVVSDKYVGMGEPFLIPFYLNNYKCSGSHSSQQKQGRNLVYCKAIPFEEALSKDQFDVLKVDIEGEEYEIFEHCSLLPACVKQIAIEFHMTRKDWTNERCMEICHRLEKQGFSLAHTTNMTQKGWNLTRTYKR